MIIVPQWLKDWLKESFQRLKMKRPKYFLYLSRFGDIMVMLAGLPYMLKQFESICYELGWAFVFPDFITALSNKLAFGIGLGFSIAARLTVKATPVAQTEGGQAVTMLDKGNMPFTTKSEQLDVEQTKPPPPIIEGLPEEVPDPKENLDKIEKDK